MEKLDISQGQLHLIFGPMWSGKTSSLQRLYKRYQIIDKKILLIKPAFDTRYSDNEVCTHDQHKITSINVGKNELANISSEYDVYFIDEGHFFDAKEIHDFCKKCLTYQKHCVISLLNGNYKLEEMNVLSVLLPLATSSEHLNAICMRCKRNLAYYTIRTTNETDNFILGSQDKYECVCAGCHPQFHCGRVDS
jgi:thymidine kinase